MPSLAIMPQYEESRYMLCNIKLFIKVAVSIYSAYSTYTPTHKKTNNTLCIETIHFSQHGLKLAIIILYQSRCSLCCSVLVYEEEVTRQSLYAARSKCTASMCACEGMLIYLPLKGVYTCVCVAHEDRDVYVMLTGVTIYVSLRRSSPSICY